MKKYLDLETELSLTFIKASYLGTILQNSDLFGVTCSQISQNYSDHKKVHFHNLNDPTISVQQTDCFQNYSCPESGNDVIYPTYLATDMQSAISFSIEIDPTKIIIFEKIQVITTDEINPNDQIILEINDSYFTQKNSPYYQIKMESKSFSSNNQCINLDKPNKKIKLNTYAYSGSYKSNTGINQSKVIYVRIYISRHNSNSQANVKGMIGLSNVNISEYDIKTLTQDCVFQGKSMIWNICKDLDINSICPLPNYINIEDLNCLGNCSENIISYSNPSNLCSLSYNICNSSLANCISCSKYSDFCFNCKEGYLLQSGVCVGCDSPCDTCKNSPSFCLSCIQNYYLDSLNNKCVKCNQNCADCQNSSTQCTSCYSGFFLEQATNTCIKYSQNCLKCDSLGVCKECAQNFTLDNNSQCICDQPEYKEKTTCTLCKNQLVGCLKCTDQFVNCLECDFQQNYYLAKNICFQSKCGDGLMIFPGGKIANKQCDDGNQIDNDGCSKNCQIEQNYSCQIDTISSRSICKLNNISPPLNQNQFQVHTKESSDQSSIENPVLVIEFDQPLKQNTQCSDILRSIDFQLQDVQRIEYTIECKSISDDKKLVELEFSFKRNIKNREYELNFTNDPSFASLNGISQNLTHHDKFPTYVYQDEKAKQQSEGVKTLGDTLSVTLFGTIGMAVIAGNIQLLFSAIDYMQMIFFLQYTNLRLPLNIILYIEILTGFQFPFVPNIFTPLFTDNNNIPTYDIPKSFSDNNYSGMFLKNAGDNLTQFIILGGVHLILFGITKIKANKLEKARHYIDEKLKEEFQWSYYLDMFWESFLPISLACFLQFTDLQSGGHLANFNVALTLIVFIIISCLPFTFLRVIYLNKNNLDSKSIKDKWRMLFVSLKIYTYSNSATSIEAVKQANDLQREDLSIVMATNIKSFEKQHQLQRQSSANNQLKYFNVNSNINLKQEKDNYADEAQNITDRFNSIHKIEIVQIKQKHKFYEKITQYFYVFLYFRKYFFTLFLVYIQESPLTQLILMSVMNLILIYYLIIAQPFKKKSENRVNIISEILMLALQISLIILIPDEEDQPESERFDIGWIFIGSSILIMLSQLIFILVNLYFENIKPLIQKCKASKSKMRIHPEVQEKQEKISIKDEKVQIKEMNFSNPKIKGLINQQKQRGSFLEIQHFKTQSLDKANTQTQIGQKSQLMIESQNVTAIHPLNDIKSLQYDTPLTHKNRLSSIFQQEQFENTPKENEQEDQGALQFNNGIETLNALEIK